jgi:hypothetical protein
LSVYHPKDGDIKKHHCYLTTSEHAQKAMSAIGLATAPHKQKRLTIDREVKKRPLTDKAKLIRLQMAVVKFMAFFAAEVQSLLKRGVGRPPIL